MVSWTCPFCGQTMYSADPARDREQVVCVYCLRLFPNPYAKNKEA